MVVRTATSFEQAPPTEKVRARGPTAALCVFSIGREKERASRWQNRATFRRISNFVPKRPDLVPLRDTTSVLAGEEEAPTTSQPHNSERLELVCRRCQQVPKGKGAIRRGPCDTHHSPSIELVCDLHHFLLT